MPNRPHPNHVRLTAQSVAALGAAFLLAAPLPAQRTADRTVAAAPTTQHPTGLLDALIRAGAAQQRGDFASMRRLLQAGHSMAPGNGQVLYFLAREEARAGNSAAPLALLDELAVQGATRDPRSDSGFVSLLADSTRSRFVEIAERVLANAKPIVRSDTTVVLRDPDFIPEGIAYDPRDAAFYVGSLHRGSIVRIDRDGNESRFLPAGNERLGQVLGVHVDTVRRQLWFATLVLDSTAPRHSNGGGDWAFLQAHDLTTGKLLTRVAAPDSALPHLLNDLVVTPDGDVYITDTEAHALYRLRAGTHSLEPVHAGDMRFRYPNGIALDNETKRLYLAHFEGISMTTVVSIDGVRIRNAPRRAVDENDPESTFTR